MALGIALTFGAALVGAGPSEAVSSASKAKFISGLVSVAQSTQRKFGVPASVSIAQAIAASDWGTSAAAKKAGNYFDTPCSASMTSAQFAKLAEAQVGKAYVLGAEAAISNPNPPRFDCSELVEWLFGRAGIRITDLAAAQYNVTSRVSGSPRTGDLVFLRNNPARSNGIGHVAVLTKKKSNGDWEVVEARGRAYGVVKSTLSYWKQRSYYAGLRRYAKFVLANGESVAASASSTYQSGCITIGSTRYGKFTSLTNSFYANAAAITSDSAYADARAVMSSIPAFVDALAKVVKPKDAAAYARTLDSLIETYSLTDYDVVPMGIVLGSGDTGAKVTALQYLLKASGYSTGVTGTFDAATRSAVKKLQKAKKLEVDGEVGQYTLSALFARTGNGTTGPRAGAVNALLAGIGYPTTDGAEFGAATVAAVKSFQATAGRSPSGTVDTNTWAALFMSLDTVAPKLSGSAKVGQTLSVAAGDWGPGSVRLSYQWYRAGTAIDGATEATYAVQPADAGSALHVVVTGLKAGYTVTARSSAQTDMVDNATFTATPTPKVSGSAVVGATLTATAGTWAPGTVALAYQWTRDGKAISGATAKTYTVQAADVAARLKVSVTGSKLGYTSVTKTSDATDPVAKGTLSGRKPTISGTRSVGKTLTAVPGTWKPSGVTLTYQWYRGSARIEGAGGVRYKLAKADKGKLVSVRVRGTLEGYTTREYSSKQTRIG